MAKHKDLSIKALWESYRDSCIPEGAHETQRVEMRRAFYAGALHVLATTYEIGGSEFSEEDGVETLESMYKECEDFLRLINEGMA